MNVQERLATVAAQLVRELRQEFPHWRIQWEDSGSWIAAHRSVGLVHADTATELRERLRTPS